MKRYTSLCLVLACFLLISCRRTAGVAAASDPADMLPEKNEVSGFEEKGTPAMMNDYQTIMEAIDGAAEKYIDFGFIEGVQQMYSNGAMDIDVQIFNHGTRENAKGIYNEFFPSSFEIIGEEEGRMQMVVDHSLMLGYTIYLWKEGIFIRVNTFEKTDFGLSMGQMFCYNISGKIFAE